MYHDPQPSPNFLNIIRLKFPPLLFLQNCHVSPIDLPTMMLHRSPSNKILLTKYNILFHNHDKIFFMISFGFSTLLTTLENSNSQDFLIEEMENKL